MKTIKNIVMRGAAVVAVSVMMLGISCRNVISDPSNATGTPYELVLSIEQDYWDGEIGDTLRSIFLEPVAMINQVEPLFDVLRINPAGLGGFIRQHRNVLVVAISDKVTEPTSYAQYDLYSKPQIMVTVVAPDAGGMAVYLAGHRGELQELFESAERDRSILLNRDYQESILSGEVAKMFGMKISIPKGYKMRASAGEDFMWLSNEHALASQGIVIYSYPYSGKEDFLPERLLSRRNEFVSRIPGPKEGSYMTTSRYVESQVRYMRIYDRSWAELRGFWDVEGDFMGGPFVSYSTLDAGSGRIVTIDGYLYSPKNPKRNMLRALEHVVYTVQFPTAE